MTGSTTEQTYEYAAFVSYRHTEPDKSWAKWLVETLETYKVPKALRERGYPTKIGKLYRDEDEAHAGAVLGDHIATALDQSRALIIVCTSNTQASPWVEREIEYFRSLGRGDRIFCLLAEGEPETSFPKSLLQRVSDRSDALAGPSANQGVAADVRPTKNAKTNIRKRDAALRLISGILGCKFDDLKRRDEERERKRRQRNWIAAGVAFLAVATSGLWYWDQNRIKTHYYSMLGSQWGQPFGIAEIDENLFNRKALAFEIQTRGGQPISILRKGSPNVETAIPEPFDHRKMRRWIIQYEADGDVERIVGYDQHGHTIRIDDYEVTRADQTAFVDFRASNGSVIFTQDGESLATTADKEDGGRTEVTRHFLRFDEDGFIERRLFRNQSRLPKRDQSGFYGHRFIRNDVGSPVEIIALNAQEEDLERTERWVAQSITYNASGLVIERAFLNSDGEPIFNSNRYAIAKYVRDETGNLSQGQFQDNQGNPATHRRGYSSFSFKFDSGGNLSERRYWLPGDQPARNNDQYHTWRGKYVGESLVWSTFLDENLEPELGPRGFAIWRGKYDESGREIEGRYFDERDRPVLDKDGHHVWQQYYDDSGNKIESRYLGLDDELIHGKATFATYAIERFDYDDLRRRIRHWYVNKEGDPAVGPMGYHRKEMRYDPESGNLVEYLLYGIDRDPVLHSDGHHRWTAEYNDIGQRIESRNYGLDGKTPVLRYGSHHIWRALYDEFGNRKEVAYFGLSGEPVDHATRKYHRWVRVYDQFGELKSFERYYANGNLMR